MVTTDFHEFDTEVPDNVLDDILTNEKLKLAKKVFHSLDEKCKELLNYIFYKDLSMQDICERMNFQSISAAKMQNYRCKKKLAELIQKNKTLVDVLK